MEKCSCLTCGRLPCTFSTLQLQMRKARVKCEAEAEPKGRGWPTAHPCQTIELSVEPLALSRLKVWQALTEKCPTLFSILAPVI